MKTCHATPATPVTTSLFGPELLLACAIVLTMATPPSVTSKPQTTEPFQARLSQVITGSSPVQPAVETTIYLGS